MANGTWHTRGFGTRHYFADAHGRILGEVIHSPLRGVYAIEVSGKPRGDYVDEANAKRAVETAYATSLQPLNTIQ